MKILIIGNGGREYALGLRLLADTAKHNLFFAPGNGATTRLGKNIKFNNLNELALWAKDNAIELTIVGGEEPLSAGVVDIFKSYGLEIFGPSKAAARLEASKVFMKDVLTRAGVRTAKHISTNDIAQADKFIDEQAAKNRNVVVKADGLCAGKGVIIAKSADEAKNAVRQMLSENSFGVAGSRVVIEEYLDGFELSFFAICDGERFSSLPVAQDHKRLLDGDEGPNTGGMGAYAPTPLASTELIKKIEKDVIAPTLKAMKELDCEFCGVLFAGIMVVDNEPIVLEFNVRFGDPECEVLMPLIDGELADGLAAAARGELVEFKIKKAYAVGVVIASQNYPYGASEPAKITEPAEREGAYIDYARVSDDKSALMATGGRVCVCVGVAPSIQEAANNAYLLAGDVKFKGAKYRKDIAYQVL
ncbi:phosphoribosylamine--glycine ligase [Campylobacter sp. 19-13652]|uniref:phosphoribosylamine--glycine ligase n=1 Tax=Campylobacter sp. 19-13652 TaxID=2840180 RepID=UPI001C7415C8|nr:phosphoribosylamine--glycine ligase [Campylobacter sp. 19-13652]BCX79130.1 phosphoribosylamine--glycine ligase [Campylobacter sp. 19-13652]